MSIPFINKNKILCINNLRSYYKVIILLKQQSFYALAWSTGETLSRKGINFLASLLLARLLAPSDFGKMAMLLLMGGFQ